MIDLSERRFRGRIELEIIAWDQPGAAVAMEAGLTPQQAIAQGLPQPEDCDLAVIVLWSRIGTQLPTDFELKEDGTPYLSGTEWEYLNALKGYRANRKPAVWVYRRQGAPQFAADDPALSDKLDQWQKLQGFFAAFSNPDGSLAAKALLVLLGIWPVTPPEMVRIPAGEFEKGDLLGTGNTDESRYIPFASPSPSSSANTK